MDEIIQIKCPFDGAVLSVRNQPGIATKNVTCPVCKHKYPFTQFRIVTPGVAGNDPETEYPGKKDEHTGYEEETRYGQEGNGVKTEVGIKNLPLGKVRLVGTGISYRLKPGRNVIGRKGTKSTAAFQIDTGEKRSMSREHIVIEVKKEPGTGFVHYLSLFKEKVNRTSVGNNQLDFGDCIILNHGDIIKLPDADLEFEIPDEDETII